MKTKIPQFDTYVCVGDSITWQAEGFDLTASIEFDEDARPDDFDCYSPIKIKQWKNDEWFFCGVVLSVSFNGVALADHAASLWGVDCNYNKLSNRYLSEVAKELEGEALGYAKHARASMLEKLGVTA